MRYWQQHKSHAMGATDDCQIVGNGLGYGLEKLGPETLFKHGI